MAEQSDKPKQAKIRLIHLLPNLLTIAAICAGITAIRYGYEGNFEMAVRLVLAACVLDGLDGRLARFMNRSTPMGAELDSLGDFVNFGVAPVLILHSWALQELGNTGWIAVLFYAICCVLRLARFNVNGRLENADAPTEFFVGIPSPAGAILVMLPMVFSFSFPDLPQILPTFLAMYICLIGLLMISRIPTYSFKDTTIDRSSAKYFLLSAAVFTAALLTYFWATMTVLTLIYVGCLVWACGTSRKSKTT